MITIKNKDGEVPNWVGSLCAALIVYVLFSFTAWSFNPAQWWGVWRFVYMLVVAILIWVTLEMDIEDWKKKEEKNGIMNKPSQPATKSGGGDDMGDLLDMLFKSKIKGK